MNGYKLIAALIILIGLFLRVHRLNIPLLEFYPTRQVQTAEITRNLYNGKASIIHPTVTYLGPKPVPFLVEFPLFNYIIAFLYKINGSVNESLGRLFSILGWTISFFLLYNICRRYVGEFAAQVALFFYTFSPLSILVSRSFQPDQWMLTTSIASIYFMDVWADKKRAGSFFISAILASFSLLIKITSGLFTLLPALYIIRKHDRLISPRAIFFFAVGIFPAFLWYFYASVISRSGNVLQTSSELSNWFGLDLFFKSEYWANMFGFENNLVLLPVGIILFIVGLCSRLKNDSYLLYVWLGSIVIYFLLFNKHNMTHEYYHLPFLPIASIFIGHGALRIINSFKNLWVPKSFLIFLLGVLIFLMMYVVAAPRAYKPIDRFSHVVEAASAIKKYATPNDLVIGAMDAGPSLVYYSDRPGWTFEINRENVAQLYAFYGVKNQKVLRPEEELELLRAEGAKIFAAADKSQFLDNQDFAKYMYSNYPVILENKNYIIFRL